MEKGKRESDGGESTGEKGKAREPNGADALKVALPAEEEVEEFFTILRRLQVAVKYFQKRNGGNQSAAPPWIPAFKREDFTGVEKSTEESGFSSLDLNSYPKSDETAFSNFN